MSCNVCLEMQSECRGGGQKSNDPEPVMNVESLSHGIETNFLVDTEETMSVFLTSRNYNSLQIKTVL